MSPNITTRIIHLDLPDMIEIEIQVSAEPWGGIARVYCSPPWLLKSAQLLEAWCSTPRNKIHLFSDPACPPLAPLDMSFYPINRSGHLVCHIHLETQSFGDRPESIRRLSMEMPTETGLVERYARHLQAIIEKATTRAECDEAILQGVQ